MGHRPATIPQPAKAIIVASGRHIYEVAAEAGVNPNLLSAVLNRRQSAPPGLADRLAAVLGVSPDDLFVEPARVAS